MNRNRGFTLLELLVVVTIIAVLASLLLPIFGNAREKARQAVCIANQRQIAQYAMIWAQDHEESYPDRSTVWQAFAIPAKLLHCPTVQDSFRDADRAKEESRPPNDYVFNGFIAGKNLSVIKHPTTEMLTADGSADACSRTDNDSAINPSIPSGLGVHPNVFSLPDDLGFRHHDACIASYCDGHVELLREPPPLWIIELNSVGQASAGVFEQEVLHSTYPVLVVFAPGHATAQASPIPAYQSTSVYQQLFLFSTRNIANQYRGRLKIVDDFSDEPLLSKHYRLMDDTGVVQPTAILFVHGKECGRVTEKQNVPYTAADFQREHDAVYNLLRPVVGNPNE